MLHCMPDSEDSTMLMPRRSLGGRPRKTNRSALQPYIRCVCQKCQWCQDNAKWDRKFEKFVDPHYYGGVRVFGAGSPLADLR